MNVWHGRGKRKDINKVACILIENGEHEKT